RRPSLVSDGSGGLVTASEGTVRRYSFNNGAFSMIWNNVLVSNGISAWLTSDPAGESYAAIRVPGTHTSIRVGRLRLVDGQAGWTQDIQSSTQDLVPVQISHRDGNTFVLFRDTDDLHLWVQKFDITGQPQWRTPGVLVRTHDNDGSAARMVADIEGGCFVLYA